MIDRKPKSWKWLPATKTFPPAEEYAEKLGVPVEKIRQVYENEKARMYLINEIYEVGIRKMAAKPPFPPIVHLSIKRIDRCVIHDWRDLQRIKNEVVGPQYEAVEIYPPEEHLVDTANQYHLFCFYDPKFRLPFGFRERMVMTADQAEKGGAKQRPFEQEGK